MSRPEQVCCTLHSLRTRNAQQTDPITQQGAQQGRNSPPETLSTLELARNRARNGNATSQEKACNKAPASDLDLLRDVARADSALVALVTCHDCQHFTPDAINPPSGLGHCQIDAAGDRLPWPSLPRRCQSFEITRAAVLRRCEAACADLQTDPAALCDWLIYRGDPEWMITAAVKRWAELIHERGGFPGD